MGDFYTDRKLLEDALDVTPEPPSVGVNTSKEVTAPFQKRSGLRASQHVNCPLCKKLNAVFITGIIDQSHFMAELGCPDCGRGWSCSEVIKECHLGWRHIEQQRFGERARRAIFKWVSEDRYRGIDFVLEGSLKIGVGRKGLPECT